MRRTAFSMFSWAFVRDVASDDIFDRGDVKTADVAPGRLRDGR
jgi:hypothetical protein